MARKEGMKPIHILVTEAERTQISTYAESHGYKTTSDYIRGLIKTDMAAHGETIGLEPDRGGDRRKQNEE